MVHIYNVILFNHKKNEIMSFAATWMHLENIILSQSERQIPHDITYMCNLKYDTNEPIYETETESQRIDLCLPRGWQGWTGLHCEFDISRCKRVYIEWINKVLYYTAQGTIFNIL